MGRWSVTFRPAYPPYAVATTVESPDGITYDVQQMTWADQGTYGDARIVASGAFSRLAMLARRIGWHIEIHDARGDVVWMGKMHRLAITHAGMQYILTMEEVSNKISLVYYKVSSDQEGAGVRTQSDWSEDWFSKERYGTLEKVVARTKLTESEAEAELSRLLAQRAEPEYTASPFQGGEPRCEIDCKGLWYYLARRYYRNVDAQSMLVASPDKSNYLQNFGEGSGIEWVCAPFWTHKRSYSMIHWTVYTSDEFLANAVTVKLNKVIDGYGANAQPTDSVVCEICEDAQYGAYIAEVEEWPAQLDELKISGVRNRSGVKDTDGAWNGVWPNLRLHIYRGRPDYGQSSPAPEYNQLGPDGDFTPYADVVDWRGSANHFDIDPEVSPWDSVAGSWTDWVSPGDDGFAVIPGPGAVIATSDPIPASRISTASSEVTFSFPTPFQVGGQQWIDETQYLEPQRRLWIRLRRTEAPNATNKNWTSRGYYQVSGFSPQSDVGDDTESFPYGRGTDAYMIVHRQSADKTEWRAPIPGTFRPAAQGTRIQLGASMWFKVGGKMQTDVQLYRMAVASEMFTQVIIESPYPGQAWGSGYFTNPFRDGSRTTQEEMQRLLDRGTDSGRGLVFDITPERTAVIRYEPLPSEAVIRRADGTFVRPDGKTRPMFPPPVGRWVSGEALYHLRDADGNAGAFYCKEASWDAESGLQLRPRTAPPLGQLPSLSE